MSPIPPDRYLIILGAMKCGTTSLFDYLATHPSICPAFPKEPNFFCQTIPKTAPAERYEELWPEFDPERHAFAMEASTAYTKQQKETGVAERIAAAGLQPRFVYLMRDPFSRIESQYNHQFTIRGESPSETLADDHLIQVSDYHLQLEPYRAHFPRESLLLVDFDDLVKAPEQTVGETLRFLGLSADGHDAGYGVSNKTEMLTTGQLWVRRNPLLMALARNTPEFVKSAPRAVLSRFSKRTEKRKMTADEREQIHARLLPGMLKLRDEYGVDVARWGFTG